MDFSEYEFSTSQGLDNKFQVSKYQTKILLYINKS
jgi:hypothetical protein